MGPYPTEDAGDKRQVILKREEWGSLPPFQEGEGLPLVLPVPAVLFTYTETDTCFQQEDCKAALLNLRDQYKEKGLYELPWNFVVGGDGTVYEARGWSLQPEPHPEFPEWAGRSLDIAHFGARGTPPNQDQMIASWYIVNDGVYNVPSNYITPLPIRRCLFYECRRERKAPQQEEPEELF